MVIREMNSEECLRVLARGGLARLACARENQPYVVPVYLAYHEASGCLYGFTTPGQKVEWMRANRCSVSSWRYRKWVREARSTESCRSGRLAKV